MSIHRRPPVPDAAGTFAQPSPDEQGSLTETILISFDDPDPVEVPATVLERRQGEFRVRHHCMTLRVGQVVSFQDLFAEGKAQVVATEHKSGYMETRFWVVSDQ